MKKQFIAATGRALRFVLPAFVLALSVPLSRAADVFGPPATIDYQGVLKGPDGNPLGNAGPANYEVEFRIYDEQTGGAVVWAEKQLVTVSAGQFSVRLGEGSPIPAAGGVDEGTVGHSAPGLPGAFDGRSRFLGVTVKIPGQTAGEISPRLAFLASPFSYVAARAQVADTVIQPAGSPPSALNVAAISYTNATMSATGMINPVSTTILADASSGLIEATLPPGATVPNRQMLVLKKDSTASMVAVQPPAGGSLNGVTDGKQYLKVRGESMTIQNMGGNDWWIVSERRDTTPVGTIIAFGGSGAIPAGYLACDGTTLSRASYVELFAAIQTAWGSTNATNFVLPNLGGRFLRGMGGSSPTYDDDVNSRFAFSAGGNTGNNVGTYQHEAFRTHDHGGTLTTSTNGAHSHNLTTYFRVHVATGDGWNGGSFQLTDRSNFWQTNPGEFSHSLSTEGNHNHTVTIPANGGPETRPDNAGVRYIIKY